jgi:tRNA(Ile)-lysidine synthase
MMRLLRGAGLKGLLGIPPVRDKIVRPLILTWRRDIEIFCAQHKLIPRVDYTNYESRYLRNRVRMKLIPQLKIFNPNVKELLLQTILMLTSDYYYINDQAQKSLKGMIKKEEEDLIELDLAKLQKLDATLQGHALREAILRLKGDLKEVHYENIQDLINLVGVTEAKRIDLPQELKALFTKDLLTIRRGEGEVPPALEFSHEMKIPGELTVKETGAKIVARMEEIVPSLVKLKESNSKIAYLDAGKLGEKVVIRNRRAGDRFMPLGLMGSKKLQDYFVDLKVPPMERDQVLLVESDGKIAWVAGHRVSDQFKITPLTKKTIRFELHEK